ncbi:MAG: thiol:disulfide interchange protein DsbA/DsbL [Wenzhouxiangellaceae bacterium]
MTNSSRLLTIILTAAAFAATLAVANPASAQQFEEGVHFERISGPDVPDSDGIVEVVEVFSYMCPACRNFQPLVGPWHEELPENVEFSRMPVAFNPSWEPAARAYFTAEVLDIVDQSHEAVFVALHDEHKRLQTIDDMAEFHSQFDVDADEFKSTASSFPVESRMRMGKAAVGKWQIRATPTLVINGKYRVSPRRGSTYGELLQIADMLIERELEAADPADS